MLMREARSPSAIVGRAEADHALAREVGWKGARGTNAKQRRTEAGEHAVERIPIDGIKGAGLPSRAIETLPTEPAAEGVPREPAPGRPMDGIDVPQLMRLAAFGGNHAISRLLARDTAVATETVTVTVRWNQTAPPKEYLKDAFDANPVSWKADVYVDGKKAGSGDGSLDLELVKGSKHDVRIVPTGDDYYRAASKKITAEAGTKDIKLGYNRENRHFTDQSWEHEGLDATKAWRCHRRHAARLQGHGQQARPADGDQDQQLLQLQQAHRRRSRRDQGLAAVHPGLQPPDDQHRRLQQRSTTSRAATRTPRSPSGARRWTGWPIPPAWWVACWSAPTTRASCASRRRRPTRPARRTPPSG
jgi:hypothetical protein